MSNTLDPEMDNNKLSQKIQLYNDLQKAIFNHFLKPDSPHLYISYNKFKKFFNINRTNFPTQNRNIVDTHLKYHNYVFNEMMPYKWGPVFGLLLFNLVRLRPPSLIFPLIYILGFDYYFKPFFMWLYQDQKIINIRTEFITKLSRQFFKVRRMALFQVLYEQLSQNDKVPNKFIKFGNPTQYIFHTRVGNVEQSNFYLLPIFDQFMFMKNFSLSSLKIVWEKLKHLSQKFQQFKKLPSKQKDSQIYIDKQYTYEMILKHATISPKQVYSFQKPSALLRFRIRRFAEIFNYGLKNQIKSSQFQLQSLTILSDHYHLIDQEKFGVQSNLPDLGIYYGLIALPYAILRILRRR